ncbi:N-6 DNA methylase [Bernardetia sp. ABR2-2B]|uniref:N-6 DNA methylase n=1 Tax=Bernardetia sp. ABR2-2B TaxID=3127472 RepID=UPI0030CD6B7C
MSQTEKLREYTIKGIEKGLIHIDGKKEYVTYLHQNKKRKYTNPEEQVQVETYCKLVLHYGYPQTHILMFESVKMGVSTKEADILVYQDEKLEKPYIVIECKKEDISELEFKEAVKQALSYAHAIAGTTKFVWVTKGNKEEFYKFNKDQKSQEQTANIPYFGETDEPKYRFAKNGFYYENKQGASKKTEVEDLKEITESDLERLFKQAHDALWAGGELNPTQAFDELDKLIFCKIWDERNTTVGQPYQFQVASDETVEELKAKIFGLYDKGKQKDPDVFSKDIDLTPERIKSIVEYFQAVNLTETDLDSKGKAFETFLGSYFRGEFGQYFTPRNVVKFTVDVLPITSEARVLDTSCGSGGFLLYVLDKVRRQADIHYPKPEEGERAGRYYNDWHRHWHDFAEKNLYGIEINDQISRVAKMNMIIHDDGHTNVVTHDGLYDIKTISERTGNTGFKENSFDFIVTNPPFGSIVKQVEKSYMQITEHQKPYYNLAIKDVNWIDKKLKPNHKTTGRENQSTEILFIEQAHHFLKEGGYLAVVLPDGILTNSSLQYVRNQIEKDFRIVAVVSLPQTTFTATGAGVKSSVLFLKKHTKQKTKEIQKLQEKIENQIASQNKLKENIDDLQKQKKEKTKDLKTKDEATKAKKKEITDEYNEKITQFKEELEEIYLTQKQEQLPDYPIFMAIAENIGYDATGKTIPQNDLIEITQELKKFINSIEEGTDHFFV